MILLHNLFSRFCPMHALYNTTLPPNSSICTLTSFRIARLVQRPRRRSSLTGSALALVVLIPRQQSWCRATNLPPDATFLAAEFDLFIHLHIRIARVNSYRAREQRRCFEKRKCCKTNCSRRSVRGLLFVNPNTPPMASQLNLDLRMSCLAYKFKFVGSTIENWSAAQNVGLPLSRHVKQLGCNPFCIHQI